MYVYTYTLFDYICMTLVFAFAFGYYWSREVSSSQFRGPWDPWDWYIYLHLPIHITYSAISEREIKV